MTNLKHCRVKDKNRMPTPTEAQTLHTGRTMLLDARDEQDAYGAAIFLNARVNRRNREERAEAIRRAKIAAVTLPKLKFMKDHE